MRLGLLITSFNRPDALNLVLKTVAMQSKVPDHIIVCDDGSGLESQQVIRDWVGQLPVCHAWQPDRNFRAARARNLGIARIQADYLVWVDGDCLLPRDFMENHLRLASRGFLVAGGRHLLAEAKTKLLLDGMDSIDGAFEHWKFGLTQFSGLRRFSAKSWKIVRTCNVGMHRDELLAVNGFDESYVGWGREDSDLVVRLMHRGIKVKSARLAACVAHLHHRAASRALLSQNDVLFFDCLNDPARVHSKSSSLTEL